MFCYREDEDEDEDENDILNIINSVTDLKNLRKKLINLDDKIVFALWNRVAKFTVNPETYKRNYHDGCSRMEFLVKKTENVSITLIFLSH